MKRQIRLTIKNLAILPFPIANLKLVRPLCIT